MGSCPDSLEQVAVQICPWPAAQPGLAPLLPCALSYSFNKHQGSCFMRGPTPGGGLLVGLTG